MGGYIFVMGGGAISWASRKQTVVATSTCEAEYIALCAACKEAVWLLRVAQFLLQNEMDVENILIIGDSQSAMKMSETEGVNRRNKHIDIAYHYVRDVVARKLVRKEYTPTEKMVADFLTKPLGRVKFIEQRESCGLVTKEQFSK